MGRNYYYLIAGLADLSFDDGKAPYTLESFREEICSGVSAVDRRILNLLPLEDDCRVLVQVLEGKADDARLQELIDAAKAEEKCPDAFPQFMYDFVREYVTDSWQDRAAFASDRLLGMFYEYAMGQKNAFIRDWYAFNLDLNNIQAAFTARKYGLDIQKLVVGDTEVAQALRTSGARDWGLTGMVPCFDDIARLQDEQDLAQRERKTDMLRWNWLEENTFFHYFSIERLFSYMVRLGMVQRWLSLDRESGQQLFRQLIGGLKGQVEVPAEFGNN